MSLKITAAAVAAGLMLAGFFAEAERTTERRPA